MFAVRWSVRGLVVRVLDSGLYCRGIAFEAKAISFTPNLPQYTQLQMSTNIVGKVPAMD